MPSARTTETFAVFVQADIPQESADIILVPLGITKKLVSSSIDRWLAECSLTVNNGLVNGEISLEVYLPIG